jgi:hypothetical protein
MALPARGICVAARLRVPSEPESEQDSTADPIVHRFTVQRGMRVALVIETRDWYCGLLQAAMARVRIEGQN